MREGSENNQENENTKEIDFKYKGQKEAEQAYSELEKLLGKKDFDMKEMQKKHDNDLLLIKNEYGSPDSYDLPSGIELDNEIKLKMDDIAKSGELSQKQYNMLINKHLSESQKQALASQENLKKQQEALEAIDNYKEKKEKIDIYIDQKFSKSSGDVIKERLKNPDFFMDMWEERESKVQSSDIPSGTPIDKPFNMDELLKVRKEMNNNPHRLELKDQYLELLSKKAASNKRDS
jgi:hypothetical protein